MQNNTKIGECIRKYGNTSKLAREAGTTYQSLNKYMKGESEPLLSTAFKLADILQVDINSFRELTKEK